MNHFLAEELAGAEWAEWYGMTPEQRFLESMKLWETYLALVPTCISQRILVWEPFDAPLL